MTELLARSPHLCPCLIPTTAATVTVGSDALATVATQPCYSRCPRLKAGHQKRIPLQGLPASYAPMALF